ncbi:MAG: bifunctional 4-hydroxy-3-methylbut-2-enyl diphosphate reductase/30S ribosomal protein S1 [Clostridia bacterium]|jgi:4-hydroxy-3-methylbut-2-enyl diphosphate reductase|nr:bifunctional 4-hydroxy-3-methylbut-2-enyl diphosphate reductase/30S ribosomal protein S1 [Clostridia bacterium]
MKIILAKSAGFCFGVNRAIQAVYNAIGTDDIYTYGPIIHNKIVIKELEEKGVKCVDSIDGIKNGTIVLRSHGVGKNVYDNINKKGLKTIDGTCPFVKKIHDIVKEQHDIGKKIIIIGDATHPEVIGINGWCDNSALIVESVEETEKIPNDNINEYAVVVQTTFRKSKFDDIISAIKKRISNLVIFNTICSATSKRQAEAVEISSKVDKMIVIGDKKSSNTQKLFEICKKNCKNTINIETISDLLLNIFDKNDKIGITAGASTPPAIIKEVIGTMSENEVKNNNEEEEVSFQQMLDEHFVTLHTGDIVTGSVISVSENEEVSVNLGYKSDGIIMRGEYSSDPNALPSKDLKPGDKIEVFVVRVNDGDGNVLLSKKRIESMKGFDDIQKAYDEKTTVEGKVTDVVKGGIIAVVNGVRVFIPSSQVSNRFVDDLNIYKGKTLEFNIIELDKSKRRIIGGRKALIEKELAAKREAIFATLEAGQKVKGTVSRITDFGAFVNLGGIDGLIHISEMSWGRITNPREVLKEGQEVEVVVLDVNKEKGKISLSLKNNTPNPWDSVAEKYPVGSIVEGKVVRMVPFGAFVELEIGVDGLVHISQIANKHVVKPEDELSIGEIIKVKVLDVNTEAKKISLSKKEADGAEVPTETAQEKPAE